MTFAQALSQNALFQAVWRVLLACGACAVLVSVASVILLALAFIVSSDDRIEKRLIEAYDKGVLADRIYGSAPNTFVSSPYGHVAHTYDMWTECVALSTNLSNAEEGLLRRIAASPSLNRNGDGDGDACRILHTMLRSGNVVVDDVYMRYWHGYLVVLRPALSVMSLETLRIITALLFYGALIFFTYQLARWFGPATWFAVLPPFFLVSDFLTVPIVTSHALPLAWIFLSAALVPILLERVPNARDLVLPVYVFAAGMITNFVSFLANTPLAPALIGFLAIAGGLIQGHRDIRRELLYAGGLIVLWYAGYFTEWIAKWVLAAAVLGVDAVVNDVLGRITTYGDVSPMRFLEATWLNFAPHAKFLAYIVVSIAIAVGSIAYGLLRGRLSRQDVMAFLALAAPLLTIIVWIEANASHSAIHAGFVSRSFLLFSVIPLLAALLVWRRAEPASDRSLARHEPV